MFRVIESSGKIADSMTAFKTEMNEHSDFWTKQKIGYKGGSTKHELVIYYNEKLNFWFCFARAGNRTWNAFGFGDPEVSSNRTIVCEINISNEGINRRIGGCFAEDEKGNIHLLYRGNIGGGRPGITKANFWKFYNGKKVFAEDGNQKNEFAYIAQLGSKKLLEDVYEFVVQVYNVKAEITNVYGG